MKIGVDEVEGVFWGPGGGGGEGGWLCHQPNFYDPPHRHITRPVPNFRAVSSL